MTSPLWSPAGETPAQLWYERSILAGLFLGAVGFGVHATLFFQAFQLLYARRHKKQEQIFLVYIVTVFLLSNIGNATNFKFGEMVFIDFRDYPGGPGAYFVEQSTAFAAVVCNCVYICLTWFQDGLLLYRFWVIFGRNWLFLIAPTVMFASSLVLSCMLITMLSRPALTLWSKISFQLALAYWAISIAFNVLVTVLICWHLLVMRRKLAKALVRNDSSSPYITVSAMLIESAFLYSATALAFLISFGVNSPVQNLWLPVLGQAQSIAPLLIILRVAEGKAWSSDTGNKLVSTLKFTDHRGTINSQGLLPAHGSATILNTASAGHMAANQELDSESVVSNVIIADPMNISMKKLYRSHSLSKASA
ncbi:hypothetical protein D9757_012959 [Collybiopsis confluens]|uniref:Uncharacterized protein n=1 Tax=Collybiopsis confluens TaxID=2823264 RepID=A0A8H5G4Z0_9AGAR|nr:hypothetical protein D9757_012959 [Collybiopsis confluens]